ncbi:MAG: glycosyltransferase family 9 protein [Pseudomonadota bacterium]
MNPTSPQSICVLRLSAIGDTCNVVPTVRQLQSTFPDATITWIIGATEHRLLGAFPGVEFIIVDKSGDSQSQQALKASLRARHFDVLLHMHASMRANLLSRYIRATRKVGFDRARARDFQRWFCTERIAPRPRSHVVDGFLQFAMHLGATPAPPCWDLPIDADADAFAARHIVSPTLIISPCSSDRRRNFRNWSVDNYVALAQHAMDTFGLSVMLTGGDTSREHEYGQAIGESVPCTNLIGQTSLPQLLALIARARVVVCPDSGPAHMANGVGTPVVGLFATSNRLRTGPWRYQALAADRYPDAVNRFLGKGVDEVRWGQRVRHPDAMHLIQLTDVTEALARALNTDA